MASDNQIIAGLYDLQHIQPRLRTYAQDKDFFRFWVLKQQKTLSVLKVISEKFGVVPAGDMRDWVLRYPEYDEIERSFYLAEASNTTDASNTKFMVSNDFGAMLNPSMRLLIDGIYVKETVTNASTDMATSRNIANGIILPEICRVISVGAPDSGGAGYTIVTVRRAHPATSYSNTAPAVSTSMRITISNIAVRANARVQPPFNKNSKMLENVVQITRHSYGVSELHTTGDGIDTYLAKGTTEHLGISYLMAEMFMTKTVELGLITGRKQINEVGGDYELEAGGILEWIPKDNDHVISLNGQLPTVERMNSIIRHMVDVSNVREIWLCLGTHAAEALANQYDKKTLWTINGELSLYYQMKIHTIEGVARDVTVNVITAPVLNDVGLHNGALALNLSEHNYNEKSKFGTFQIGYKHPFTDDPKDKESYHSNEGFKGTWRELYGAWSLIRRLQDTHFMILDFPQSNFSTVY